MRTGIDISVKELKAYCRAAYVDEYGKVKRSSAFCC